MSTVQLYTRTGSGRRSCQPAGLGHEDLASRRRLFEDVGTSLGDPTVSD